ncbi:uncharacterized protein LOC127139006 isoform X2 [Lates calcarifer]|nr:uncharacterized protein LOC127139006 isoform X2 [Lates calcarifer]
MTLQRVLQTWGNNFSADCVVVDVSEDGTAVITIKPASALSGLQKLVGQTLFNKEGTPTVTVKSVSLGTPELETQIPDDASIDLPPSFVSEPQNVEGHLKEQSSAAGQETNTCDIPMHHFSYVTQNYKEEIKRIEKVNGVKLVAEVKLTFEADQKDGRPNYAFSEFINLVQKCSGESRGFTVPLKNMNPKQWSDALKIIQRPENKLLLTLSSEEMTVCGPRQSQDAVRKSISTTQRTLTNTDTSTTVYTGVA